MKVEIAIVGGGLIGRACARALLSRGAKVAIIDAGEALPGAGLAAAGMLGPHFELLDGAIGDAFFDFGVKSLAAWPGYAAELADETGVDLDFRQDGAMGVAANAIDAAALERQVAYVQGRGGQIQLLSGEEARVFEASLSPRVMTAAYSPGDAQVDPRKLLDALQQSAARRGVVWVEDTVRAISSAGLGQSLTLAGGGIIEAEATLLATGAAPPPLSDLAAPAIFPTKGEALAVLSGADMFQSVVRGAGVYICPKADGQVYIGATEVEHCDDLEIDNVALMDLRRRAHAIAPALAKTTEVARWSGLRPTTPDKAPILGRAINGPDNIFLALGHYRNGVLLAPATAEAMADLILTDDDSEIAPFSAARFAAAPVV